MRGRGRAGYKVAPTSSDALWQQLVCNLLIDFSMIHFCQHGYLGHGYLKGDAVFTRENSFSVAPVSCKLTEDSVFSHNIVLY